MRAEPVVRTSSKRDGFDESSDWVPALSAAIEAAAAERRALGRMKYRGTDLTHAFELELYWSMLRNDALRTHWNSTTGRVIVSSRLERDIGRRLVGPGVSVELAKRPRRYLRRLSRPIRSLQSRADARRWRESARRSNIEQGSVLFLLNGPKFLRFIKPVLRKLPRGGAGVISMSAELTSVLESTRFPHVAFDWEQSLAPAGRLPNDAPAYLGGVYDFLREICVELDPQCVVSVEGNAPTDELAARVAADLGIPSTCLQQGWGSINYLGSSNMRYDAFAVWGRGFAELLEPHNPGQRFVVTGNPSLDRPHSTSGVTLPPRLGKRRVLFTLQHVAEPVLTERGMASYVALIQAVAEQHLDTTIFVREHPGAPLSSKSAGINWTVDAPNVVLVPPISYPLRDVLLASDIVVAMSSTTMLEAIALGRPAVVYNPTGLKRYSPDIEHWEAGAQVDNFDAAVILIDRLLRDDEFYRSFSPGIGRFRDTFFDGTHDRAGERIVELFDELQAESSAASDLKLRRRKGG